MEEVFFVAGVGKEKERREETLQQERKVESLWLVSV